MKTLTETMPHIELIDCLNQNFKMMEENYHGISLVLAEQSKAIVDLQKDVSELIDFKYSATKKLDDIMDYLKKNLPPK